MEKLHCSPHFGRVLMWMCRAYLYMKKIASRSKLDVWRAAYFVMLYVRIAHTYLKLSGSQDGCQSRYRDLLKESPKE